MEDVFPLKLDSETVSTMRVKSLTKHQTSLPEIPQVISSCNPLEDCMVVYFEGSCLWVWGKWVKTSQNLGVIKTYWLVKRAQTRHSFHKFQINICLMKAHTVVPFFIKSYSERLVAIRFSQAGRFVFPVGKTGLLSRAGHHPALQYLVKTKHYSRVFRQNIPSHTYSVYCKLWAMQHQTPQYPQMQYLFHKHTWQCKNMFLVHFLHSIKWMP